MNSSTAYCLMLTFYLILISHFSFSANGRVYDDQVDLIAKVCNDADNQFKADCLILLRKDPKVVVAKNYCDISKAVLELAIIKTTAVTNFIKELAKNNSSPSIKECITDYQNAVASFISSKNELNVDTLAANYDAKVAGDGPDMCSKSLKMARIVNPTVIALNYQTKLLSVCASLATNYLPENC
ncbi:hypothetical protein Fmac_023706 [Flemingia macrophylla]|uniref:Pectinesterase inhibitor domain-containing protein n=1 Tax=Flemingia macrophylla TaxID=520843 RepID=A0ABD1LMU3_9FABA